MVFARWLHQLLDGPLGRRVMQRTKHPIVESNVARHSRLSMTKHTIGIVEISQHLPDNILHRVLHLNLEVVNMVRLRVFELEQVLRQLKVLPLRFVDLILVPIELKFELLNHILGLRSHLQIYVLVELMLIVQEQCLIILLFEYPL